MCTGISNKTHDKIENRMPKDTLAASCIEKSKGMYNINGTFFPSRENDVALIPFRDPKKNPMIMPPKYKYSGKLISFVISMLAKTVLTSSISGNTINTTIMIIGDTNPDNTQFEK